MPAPAMRSRTRRSHRGRIGLALAAAAGLGAAGLGVAGLAQGHQPAARSAAGPSITSRPWGSYHGRQVRLYTLSNGHMKVQITNFGGIIHAIDVPDRNGTLNDVTLGFRNLAGYVANDQTTQPSGGSGTTYFGATIGRFGNRIAKGRFTLDGTTYHLPINNGPNTLHGGTNAWNKQVWTPVTSVDSSGANLQLTYTSPNGQDGFPGTVVATVTFTLASTNKLTIQYHATTDKATPINLTNHSYFNLDGQASGNVYGQKLMINANRYTPTDSTQIPTGKLAPVAGTPFDFRHLTAIGARITADNPQLILAHGYDHNWVLNRNGSGLSLAAKAVDPVSGRVMTTYTTQPGVQVYTGNFLVGELVGTTGQTYRQGSGFTEETQHFPNSPNQKNFPSTILRPGKPYDQTTVFAFSTMKK